MDNEELEGVKFSEFPSATPGDSDEVVGLHNNDNVRFSVANFVLAIRQGLANIFVPLTRTINGKALNNDISLNASDVGAVATSAVGAADGVASLDSNGKVPGTQLNLSGKQDTITASGILKGDGAGGVSAATPGTDYQAPLTIDATPTENSTNPVQSGGVYTDVRTRVPVYGMGKNLLDNAYFVGGGSQLGSGILPINQRGQTSYTVSGPIFDRWKLHTGVSLTLASDGVVVQSNTTFYGLFQPVESFPIEGRTYTVSVLYEGGLFSWTFTRTSASDQWSGVIGSTGFYINISATRFTIINSTSGNATIKIKAVKMEYGTEQTLAHQENGVWVLNEIPDYWEELVKCQRYFFAFNINAAAYAMVGVGTARSAGAVECIAYLPITMRNLNSPTLSYTGSFQLTDSVQGGQRLTVTAISLSLSTWSGSSIGLSVTASGATAGKLYYLRAANDANARIFISAEP